MTALLFLCDRPPFLSHSTCAGKRVPQESSGGHTKKEEEDTCVSHEEEDTCVWKCQECGDATGETSFFAALEEERRRARTCSSTPSPSPSLSPPPSLPLPHPPSVRHPSSSLPPPSSFSADSHAILLADQWRSLEDKWVHLRYQRNTQRNTHRNTSGEAWRTSGCISGTLGGEFTTKFTTQKPCGRSPFFVSGRCMRCDVYVVCRHCVT